jgi:hypothetical protein
MHLFGGSEERHRLNEPYKCLSSDWKARYTRHKLMRRAALQCGRQKGLTGIMTDEYSDNQFDLAYEMKCSAFPEATLRLAQLKTLSELFKGLGDFTAATRDYSAWIGQRRTSEVLGAIRALDSLRQSLCGDFEPDRCVEEYGEKQIFVRYSEVINKFLGPLPESSDSGATLRAIFEVLSPSNNIIINIAICDILADRGVSEKVAMSRDDYCQSHGLSRYIAVADRYAGEVLQRSFQTSEGASEVIETNEVRRVPPSNFSEPYDRSWIRKFVPADK